MWTLAHAHGTLLGLIHIAFAVSLPSLGAINHRLVSRALTAASVLLPGGFFLGGVQFYAGDPGLGVVLVPVGAALLLSAAWLIARGVRLRTRIEELRSAALLDRNHVEESAHACTRRGFIATAACATAAVTLGSAQQRRVRTIVGNGTAGSQQDAADAAQALVNNPYGVVIGPDAALYFCEVDTGRTRRLDLAARSA